MPEKTWMGRNLHLHPLMTRENKKKKNEGNPKKKTNTKKGNWPVWQLPSSVHLTDQEAGGKQNGRTRFF